MNKCSPSLIILISEVPILPARRLNAVLRPRSPVTNLRLLGQRVLVYSSKLTFVNVNCLLKGFEQQTRS